MSPHPKEKENIPSVNNISDALKTTTKDIETNLPVKIIDAGLTTLLVPMKSFDSIINLKPDLN